MKRNKVDNPQDQDNMHPQQDYLSWEGISSLSIKIQDVVQLLDLKEKAWVEVFYFVVICLIKFKKLVLRDQEHIKMGSSN